MTYRVWRHGTYRNPKRTKSTSGGNTIPAIQTFGFGTPAPAITGSPVLLYSWDPDNSSLVTMTGNNITALAGADGTSLALTSGSGPTRPIVNGRYVAQFLGTSSQFMSALGGVAGGTQVVIFDSAGPALAMTTGLFGEMNSASASGANRQEILKINGAGAYVTARKADNNSLIADANSGLGNDTNIHIGIATFLTGIGNSYLFFDGVGAPYTSTGTADLATGINNVVIGARLVSSAFTQYHTGNIYRVLKYSAVLSNAQIEEIAVWAATNYGTPNLA